MNFIELTYEQEKTLLNMKVGRAVISAEDIEVVNNTLNLLEINTEAELRGIRNSVVKLFSNATRVLRMLGIDNFKQVIQLETNMSGIVAVIDSRLFNLGYEV